MLFAFSRNTRHMFLWTAASICFCFLRAEAQQPSPGETLKFSLAAVAVAKRDATQQLISLADNTVLKTGDLIKFYVEFEKPAFLYVFHEDPRGGLTLLFPTPGATAEVPIYSPVYIPEAKTWIELDAHTGKETFHLLAAAARMEKIEDLMHRYAATAEGEARQEAAQAVLAELKALKRGPLRAQAEKPQRIAGKLRGSTKGSLLILPELRDAVSEITATGNYCKSLAVEHR